MFGQTPGLRRRRKCAMEVGSGHRVSVTPSSPLFLLWGRRGRGGVGEKGEGVELSRHSDFPFISLMEGGRGGVG